MERDNADRWGALAGVRVTDFTWVKAGPQATRILAMLGAEVIRVEWPENPDMTRVGSLRARGGSISDGDHNNFNCNKLSVTLNVRRPEGRDLLKRLIAVSDVVIENFSSRVMESWGLGYDVLRAINPGVVYVSMAGFGHGGPYRDYITYGPTVQALTGLTHVSGLPDRPPAGWGYSYMDHTGGYYAAIAVLTALHHRHRTGEGQHVDLSQVEVGATLTGAAILDATVNGRSTRRPGFPAGNRTHWPDTSLTNTYRGPHAAPHNHYRCRGGGHNDWCVIACFTEAEWQALVRVMGDPEWAADERFATLLGRLEHQADLDARIQAWTETLDKYAVMQRLQAAGVAAAAVASMADRMENDPQLRHRGAFETRHTHPRLGEHRYEGLPFKLSRHPWEIRRYGPLYGEDNEYVFRDILGLPADDLADLEARHIFWPRGYRRD